MKPAVVHMARLGRLGVASIALYASAIVVGAMVAPATRVYWGTQGFAAALVGLLAVAGAGALGGASVALWRTRRRLPGERLAALFLVAGLAALLLRHGSSVDEPMARLREQTHIVQYGGLALLYVFVLRRRFRDGSLYTTALLLVLLVALLDEAVQWWHPERVGTLADVRLDLLSGGLGVALAALVLLRGAIPIAPSRRGWATTLRGVAAVALVGAAFIDRVHVAKRVEAYDLGVSLATRFSAVELAALADSWLPRVEPKSRLQRILRGEDLFRAEARWHVARRNELLQRGSRVEAAQEQWLLERFYAAYLKGVPADNLEEQARDQLARGAGRPRAALIRSGPPGLVVGLDRGALWLAAAALAVAALFASELLLARRPESPIES